jgi:hypothetical protein
MKRLETHGFGSNSMVRAVWRKQKLCCKEGSVGDGRRLSVQGQSSELAEGLVPTAAIQVDPCCENIVVVVAVTVAVAVAVVVSVRMFCANRAVEGAIGTNVD